MTHDKPTTNQIIICYQIIFITDFTATLPSFQPTETEKINRTIDNRVKCDSEIFSLWRKLQNIRKFS